MKRVAIMAMEGATAFSVLGSQDMLNKVNLVPQISGHAEKGIYFITELVGVEGKEVASSSGNPFICHSTVNDAKHFDLILLPSCDGDVLDTIQQNYKLIPWLREQHRSGATLASMCTGAFILAETGLMNDRKITTHWAYFDLLEQHYPAVQIEHSDNIVEYESLIAAGGGTSFIELVLYLIEKYYGHQLATLCAKYMLVDMEKLPQSTFTMFMPQKLHGDQKVLHVQDFVENHYSQKLTIDMLAEQVNLSGRTLARRFKKATGVSPHAYILATRVEAARKLLENADLTVENIAGQVGYADLASFRNAFVKRVGIGLSEYRKKFNRMIPYRREASH